MIGKTVSHYKILEKLGQGGMGVVYKAKDIKLERVVALKFLPPHLSNQEAEKKRFIHEAKAASALEHNNICAIYEINETDDGQLFIAMSYLEGKTLREKIDASPVKVDVAIGLAIQAAEGLKQAHEKGIVHRDIKPANIMVTTDGTVKIMDFGLAKLGNKTKLTQMGTTLGTFAYMSPEQSRGEEVDRRTDIWSLGVVLFEMLTGQMPFKGDYEQAIIYSIKNENPEPVTSLRSGIPMELERIINKAIQKDSGSRYQSMTDMIVDLNLLKRDIDSGIKSGSQIIKKQRVKKSKYLYGSVLFLIIIIIAGFFYFYPEDNTHLNSIAVLPLENLSDNPDQEYLADGLTDALINELGQISSIRVISRTSIRRYKKIDKPLIEIAKELNTDLLIEGSVLKSGDKVRIIAKLINPIQDRQIWTKSYERDMGNILALQDDIALDIMKQIGTRLSEETRIQASNRKNINPKVLDLYFKGIYTEDVEYFQQAIKLDSNFALAHAKIAASYYLIGLFGDIPPREAFLIMKNEAIKALEIDNTLGEAHGYLAVAWLHYDLNWKEAGKEFKKAFELNPSLSMLHHLYAHYLMAKGSIEESMAEIKLANELDPFSWDKGTCFGWHCLFSNDFEGAIKIANAELQTQPEDTWAQLITGWAYEQKNMQKEAINSFQKVVSLWDGFLPLSSLGHAYGVAGQRQEAEKILNNLIEKRKKTYISAYDIAVVWIGLNQIDETLYWLNEAYEERSGFLVYIKCDRRFDRLTSDPRFQDLLHKINPSKSDAISLLSSSKSNKFIVGL